MFQSLVSSLFLSVTIAAGLLTAGEPYCGVYSLYASARILGHSPEFGELLHHRYIKGWEGSDLGSLARGAEDLGLSSLPVSGMGIWDLRLATTPVILHTRSSPTSAKFDHWVVYLGESDGGFDILDSQHGRLHLSPSELLSLWDGAGLIVARGRGELLCLLALSYLARLGLFFAGGMFLCAVLRGVFRLFDHFAMCGLGTRIAVASSCLFVVGAGGALVAGGSPMKGGFAARTIEGLYEVHDFRQVGLDDVRSLLDSVAGSYVVDARREIDFRHGHLPHAVNIPISVSPEIEKETVEHWDRKRTVLVYCQTDQCHYSDVVAKRLVARGFNNILIYRNGYAEWKTHD